MAWVERSRTILLVEDSPLRRQVLAEELGRRGYLVTDVADSKEALALLQEVKVDLLLVGFDLQDRGLRHLTESFRRNNDTQADPVILYSATLKKDLVTIRDHTPEMQRRLESVIDLLAVPEAVEIWFTSKRVDPGKPQVRGMTPVPGLVIQSEVQTVPPSEEPTEDDALSSRPGSTSSSADEDELADLRALLEAAPDDVDLLAELAARLYSMQRFLELDGVCRKLIELDHQPALHHFQLGDVLYRAKKIEEAIATWLRAIELEPDDLRAAKAARRIGVARRVLEARQNSPSDPPEERRG